MRLKEFEPLSNHTTYRTGGLSRYFIEPYNLSELFAALKFAKDKNFFILGAGSNVLFSDKLFDGVVISLKKLNRYVIIKNDVLICGAGCLLDNVINFSVSNNLSGLENLSGIPGSVGGAIYMNAGAFDIEIKDFLTSVKIMDFSGNIKIYKKNDLNFAYRSSGLKDEIVVEAVFTLRKGKYLENKRLEILKKRGEKQPLEYPSCGSVFKRPKEGFAGVLIENCGLKGYSIGGAEVSKKHANFIINKGNATSSDIYNLINYVKEVVYKKYGIILEEEVKLINF